MTRSPVAPCGGVVAPSAQRLPPSRLARAGPTVTGSSATGRYTHWIYQVLYLAACMYTCVHSLHFKWPSATRGSSVTCLCGQAHLHARGLCTECPRRGCAGGHRPSADLFLESSHADPCSACSAFFYKWLIIFRRCLDVWTFVKTMDVVERPMLMPA